MNNSRTESPASQNLNEEDETQPFDDGTPTQPVPKRLFMLSSLPVSITPFFYPHNFIELL